MSEESGTEQLVGDALSQAELAAVVGGDTMEGDITIQPRRS